MRRGSFVSVSAAMLVAIQMLCPSLATAAILTIPLGTPVSLAFDEALTPATVEVGSIVHLSVLQDVTVDGVIAIPAGAPATAEVTRSEKPGSIGKPAVISLECRSVQAVDGTLVPIQGTKLVEGENKQTSTLVITIVCCILGLFLKGGDVEIPAGSTMDCTVQLATEIEA